MDPVRIEIVVKLDDEGPEIARLKLDLDRMRTQLSDAHMVIANIEGQLTETRECVRLASQDADNARTYWRGQAEEARLLLEQQTADSSALEDAPRSPPAVMAANASVEEVVPTEPERCTAWAGFSKVSSCLQPLPCPVHSEEQLFKEGVGLGADDGRVAASPAVPTRDGPTCIAPDCDEPPAALGLCARYHASVPPSIRREWKREKGKRGVPSDKPRAAPKKAVQGEG